MTGNGTEIKVNPKIYPIDVVYCAGYVFLDNFYVIIDGDPEKEIIVKVFPKEGQGGNNDIEKEFNNELVNYAFYKKQVERNGDIRKSIMQRALLTSELSREVPIGSGKRAQESHEEFDEAEADYIDDPEGIAIPWEEKFGKKGSGKGER